MRIGSRAFVWACLALGVATGLSVASLMFGPAADERYYAEQVRWFMARRFELVPGITMLPGYHGLLAATLAPFGDYSDYRARMATCLIGLSLFPLAWALARRDEPGQATLKAAQALLQPLSFPYLFLIYTEAWSLSMLLAMILATLSGRHFIAAAIGLIGTVMRQDFVFWVAFAAALAALENVDWASWRSQFGPVARAILPKTIPYLAVMAVFVAFVVWNEGVAMADKQAHPYPYNLANLYFFYLCAWLVFLPHCIAALPRIAGYVRRPSIVIALLLIFAIYWTTWSNPHIYNQEHLRYWLHNEVLYWMDRRAWVRGAAFAAMAWAALTLLTTRLPDPRYYLLHVFAPLAALLHPLVEQRYYLPAFLLYILWRQPIGESWEISTLIAYLPAGIFLLGGIAMGAFFP